MTDREALTNYCAKIGADRSLVQAAGGNVSWKTEDTLWVKASGTWLADAMVTDIFLPVDLGLLRRSLASGNFEIVPKVLAGSPLRPSIETLFHALIPSRIVLHTHSIEALATLVREEAENELETRIGTMCDWVFVDYFMPGPKLAEAIQIALRLKPSAKIVFMRNHGIIIGAESVEEMDRLLQGVLSALCHKVHYTATHPNTAPEIPGFQVAADTDVHALVQHPHLQKRIAEDWVLYPDHVIFLDVVAKSALPEVKDQPTLNHLFVPNVAVYERNGITRAARAQLLCYSDVIVRQPENVKLVSLNEPEISELLNWDAEKFRQAMNE